MTRRMGDILVTCSASDDWRQMAASDILSPNEVCVRHANDVYDNANYTLPIEAAPAV